MYSFWIEPGFYIRQCNILRKFKRIIQIEGIQIRGEL